MASTLFDELFSESYILNIIRHNVNGIITINTDNLNIITKHIKEYELNLHKIYSIPLLEEILKFSYDGNFDRHSAMLVAMLYKKELLLKPQLELNQKSVYDDGFFVDLKYKLGLNQTL